MKRFITAGAGSGKTYKITHDLAEKIQGKKLRPEQVIMTTYTKVAAQELREKAKRELVSLGLHKEAHQMEHALIGTVHSVANTFLTKYWYLLGITPDTSAIEEDELILFRDQSLRELLTKDDREFLYHYCETYEISYIYGTGKTGLNYEFWKEDLCKVLDYMQWYNITDEQLDESLNTTTERIIKLLSPAEDVSLDNPPASLRPTYDTVLAAVNAARKSKRKEEELNFLLSLSFDSLSLDDVQTLYDITEHRIKDGSCNEFMDWAAQLTSFPVSIADDHRKYAKTIFRLAKKWRGIYRTFKDEHHLIDFNDMEGMFLRLLGMEEVREDIRTRFSMLYVDEFQDSNPIQVCIFQKLSELVDTCYVGDKKQAIYGFRGADTELTTAVADSIEDRTTLPYSYRSVKPLVEFSNTVFTKIFSGMKDVMLSMPPTNGNTTEVEKPLRLWQWRKDENLAPQIQQFILREKLDYKDVAVLAKKNQHLDKLADELRKLGIPVCREDYNIKDSRTGRLIKALLTLVTTPGNMLARAEVAYLTEPDYNLTHIIEQRLTHITSDVSKNQDYLKDLPILKRLFAIRDEIKAQSVSALIESLIIELNLYSLVHHWNEANAEETNLQIFIEMARKYEESSTKLARPATIAGFIDYFCNQHQEGAADNSGIRLFTYHKSKGLEWKAVIMLSLDNNVTDTDMFAKNCIFGCHTHRKQLPTPDCTNPPMTISLVRNIYTKSAKEKIPSAVISRLQQHPFWNTIHESYKQEMARLLYVGVTRARNILILASKGNDNTTVNLNWFSSTGLHDVHQTLSEDSTQDVLGIGIPVEVERFDTDNLLAMPEHQQKYVFDIAADFSPLDNLRNLSPSQAGATPHELGRILCDTEQRIPESVKKDDESYARMGDFIHQVFCCMDDNIDKAQIEALRNDYGFSAKNMPEPGRLIDAWNFLINKLEQEYGHSVNRIHEMPFRHMDKDGHLVNGQIDFVWETEEAYVIVDYKTCASSYSLIFNPQSPNYAGTHGNQLDCYQQALEAEGKKPVKARLIYYPVTSFLVEVK